MTRKRITFLLTLVLVGSFAACSDDDDDDDGAAAANEASSEAELRESFCDQQSEITETVVVARSSVSSTTTVDDVRNAIQTLGQELDQIEDTASEIAADRWEDVQAAYIQLGEVFQDVEGDDPLSGIADEVTAAQAAIDSAWTALREDVDC